VSVLLSTLAVLLACSNQAAVAAPTPTSAPAPTAGPSGELVVFAASSLTDAFNEVKAVLEAAHPNLAVSFNYAATSALRTQIEQGAKADVFASANEAQMNTAITNGIIEGEPHIFTTNRLVVIAPVHSTAVASLADLAKPGIKLVLAAKEVPVGGYSRDSFNKMDASGRFEPDFAAKVLANLVSEEANVRQVVGKVALGEADAGVSYTTDVTADVAAQLRTIAVPDGFNVLATYPFAVVKGAPNPEAAQAFIAFVLSPGGQAIMAKWGFGAIP
jgi:molybdate transport system substrate-binding protein